MFATRISRTLLDRRLDAEFFRPSYLVNSERLQHSDCRTYTLAECSYKLKCGPFGSSLHASAYVNSGIPFIHPTSFSNGVFDELKVERIRSEDHSRLRSTMFQAPALVFARVGSPCCGVLPGKIGDFNIHGDVIGVQCNNRLDPHFGYAFFHSPSGNAELTRFQAGSTRPRTNTEELARMRVVVPSRPVQTYIGDKVRQAERLRERGKRFVERSRKLVEALLLGRVKEMGITEGTLDKDLTNIEDLSGPIARKQPIEPKARSTGAKSSRIGTIQMQQRLDAGYYTPEVLANDASLRTYGAILLSECIDLKYSGYGVLPPSEAYVSSERGVGLIRGGDLSLGSIRSPEVFAPVEYRTSRGTAIEGDVLLLIKGACIDEAAGVGLVTSRQHGLVFNGSCYRIRTNASTDQGFLIAYFLTEFFLLQKRREIANTGIAYNSEDSVLGYLIPRISHRVQKLIGNAVKDGLQAGEHSADLIVCAKLLVEALIEGHLTESELKEAQEALERGDRSPDRAILARLTRKGIDVPGEPPLFPDLDALYRAIDQVNESASAPDQGANP